MTINNTSDGPELSWSPGRIDPQNAAWNDTTSLGYKGSRKPLVGEFMFNGQHLFVVANHLSSKGGDDDLMGKDQPPVEVTKPQRMAQAQVEHDFLQTIFNDDPAAKVVVVGDLNDFQFSDPVMTLTGQSVSNVILHDLLNTLPANERYSL